jgi:hypothetical protein
MAKIISIEDTREITLYHANWIPGVTRNPVTKAGEGEVTMFDLLKAALRQRPEYILLGEVRGAEALTLFQAMSTGHTTYSTIHAEDPQSVVSRPENEPINVPPVMLQALDIISVQIQTRLGGRRVRRANTLVEIIGIDPQTKNLRINELFRWDPATDGFTQLGESHKLREIMKERGWTRDELKRELHRREKVLEWMVCEDTIDYRKVAEVLQTYNLDPDGKISEIEEGEEGIIDALKRYEKIKRLKFFLHSPFRFFIDRPYRSFYITLPLAVIYLLTILYPAWQIPQNVDHPVFYATLCLLIPYSIFFEIRAKRIRDIERMIPEFLRRLKSINETGLNLVECIRVVIRSNLGVLTSEIVRVARSLGWGNTLEDAFHKLEVRVRTGALSRAITLLVDADREQETCGMCSLLQP